MMIVSHRTGTRRRKNSITCILCIARDVIYQPSCLTCIARMVLTLPEGDEQEKAIQTHGDRAAELREAVKAIRGQW